MCTSSWQKCQMQNGPQKQTKAISDKSQDKYNFCIDSVELAEVAGMGREGEGGGGDNIILLLLLLLHFVTDWQNAQNTYTLHCLSMCVCLCVCRDVPVCVCVRGHG